MELDSSTFQLHGPRLKNCRLAFKYGVVKCSRFVKNRWSITLAPTIFTDISVYNIGNCAIDVAPKDPDPVLRCFCCRCCCRRRDSSRKMMAVSFEVSKISWTNFLVTRTHRRILCWSCDYRERSNLKINKYRGNRDIFVEFFVETQLFVFNNRSHVFPFKRVLAESHVSS